MQAYEIHRFEQAGSSLRLRAQVTFINGSRLYIRETVIEGAERTYAYHWQTAEGLLLVRWDNAPHWAVETYPHHKHVGSQQNVLASFERSLEKIMAVISAQLTAG